MNKDIVIVGAFHEIIELCELCGYTIVGFVDNKLQGEYYGYPVLGTDKDAYNLYHEHPHCDIVISPDKPAVRLRLSKLYADAGFDFATVVSPKANISRTAHIGKGTLIQSGVNISCAAQIGNFVRLNTNVNVMHNTIVGDFATVAPNAVLLGYVNVGMSAYIGANSTILPRMIIAAAATVGAGAVVTRNVAAQTIVKGVPAK